MRLRHTAKKRRLTYVLMGVVIVILIFVLTAVREIGEHLSEISEYCGREAAMDIIGSALEQIMAENHDTSLYTLKFDDTGKVIAVQLDTAAANRLKNQLTDEVSCGLSELDENGISIPIGTLLGIPVFSGKGHSIDLGVQQLGAVKSEFSSKLEAAGINQTRLTVYVTITVEIRAILPNGHRDISVCEEQIINDSLIVGDIPQYYRQS